MAVPSRAFVGILVFALLASLAIVPYTVLILAGYEPAPDAPHDLLFPEPSDTSPGDRITLVLASAFCLGLVAAAWRGLLLAARQDAARRKARRESQANGPATGVRAVEDEQPPGYQ